MTDSAKISGIQSTMIMLRLKNETKAYHTILESLPYFRALIDHKLPLECYVNQLRSLAIIHGVMESEIANSENKMVMSVWDDGLRKLPLIECDLKFFEPRVIPDATASVEAALVMTQKIRLRQAEFPVTLLGYLYVFEGSTLGNSIHKTDISAAFHLDGLEGCRYYSSYLDQVQSKWMQFAEKMNSVLNDPACHDAVIAAAHEAFSGLNNLYNTLYPLTKKEKTFHVTRINPEAGNHPIPEDEREIQAALNASDRGWAEFPYYEQRYGQRGKRFSDSDTCWLVTLTSLDPESMQKQIDWIGRILSTRGMPLLMLEFTLRILYEELAMSLPDKTATYEKLLRAATILTETRNKLILEKLFQSLSSEFEQAVGSEMADRYKNTGKLLVSSVADEKGGIKGAVCALQDWMTDTSRFPEQWITAINSIIIKARQVSA